MPERRVFPRTDLKVYARGYVTLGDGIIFPFGATVTNLSEGGAKLTLNPDAMDRFNITNLLKDSSVTFDNMPMTFDVISYVLDNVRVTGQIAYAVSRAEGAFLGVKFAGLDPDTRANVRHVIEAKPELEMADSDVPAGERNFSSMSEFLVELTAYCIHSGKEDMFRIAGELFGFVGMHISIYGEPHLDLIESLDRPGRIFCPDCKEYVDPGLMI